MSQGIATFAGQEMLGGKMTFNRGIRPSRGHLYLLPQSNFDRKVGSLAFTYPGGGSISFPDAALLTNTFRPYRMNRAGWRWSVQVVDRRWKWRYARIDGTYNEFGTSPRRDSIKNIRELATLCLDALGETGYDVSNLPTTVHPPVVWNRARADLELQWLCDLIGMIPVLKVSTNTVTIEPLHSSSGAAMPLSPLMTPLTHQWKPAVIPQTLRVQGDPTIVQSKLTLEAVGLETDGKVEPIADLSYKPAGGWSDQWPYFFSDVAAANRHLALQTVFRWFRPSTGWNGDGTTINSFEQLELLDTTIERVTDDDGVDRPVPPQVQGVFWPYCDLAENTAADSVYTGRFRLLKDIGVLEFEEPVIKWSSNTVAEPDLGLICAYRVRNEDGDGYATYTRDLAVSSSTQTTKPRILHHPELTKEKIVDAIYGSTSDNETTIEAEADVYLSNIESTYDFTAAQDAIYEGNRAIDLDGAITQVQWKAGFGRPAVTRIGRFTEFDIYSMHHQQRRAMERLAQMAERMAL